MLTQIKAILHGMFYFVLAHCFQLQLVFCENKPKIVKVSAEQKHVAKWCIIIKCRV